MAMTAMPEAMHGSAAMTRVVPGAGVVTVEWRDGGADRFHYVWLRDNCPCPLCLHASGQRLVDILDLAPEVTPRRLALDEAGWLKVCWETDGHDSRYAADWLKARAYGAAAQGARRRRPVLWGAELAAALPAASWPLIAAEPAAERRWLERLLELGFALLHEVPPEPGMVAAVGERIGFVRTTNYGRLFDVISQPDPNNLAYTALALGVHTDNPYRDPTPGYQLLHCLVAEAPGGDTLLVDGFRAAAEMRAEDPAGFALLTRVARPFRFADAGADLLARFPVIGTDLDRAVTEVHFNNRSAAPLDIEEALVEPYYRAYRRFAQILRRPANELIVHLDPGDLIVLENGRALHGRTAFDAQAGRRHLQGCYVDKDGVESRWRVLSRPQPGREMRA